MRDLGGVLDSARRDDHREPARRGPDRADPGGEQLLPRHRTPLRPARARHKPDAHQTRPLPAMPIPYLVIGLIFGLANAFIKPILSFVSAPITCLTLGLFSIVINALMLALTSWLSGFTPFQFTIDSFFFSAIFAAIIVSIVSALLGWLAPERSAESDRR